jgi:FSR family fosmidomycin resistance protein-like MFS transporter
VRARIASVFFLFFAIEFFDELVFGVRESAWPLIRDDFSLSYTQVGLLLAIPAVFSAFVEPVIGVLGDAGWRRRLILGGGLLFASQLALITVAPGFAILLVAFCLLYPASGAFVSLAQGSMIDLDHSKAEQLMAKWTFAGSVGVVAGPLVLGGALLLGVSWQGVFAALAVLGLALSLVALRKLPAPNPDAEDTTLREAIRGAGHAIRRAAVWRWLVLLAFSDLVLDILLGFLAVYFVDEVGVSAAQAGIAIVVWSVVGLAGDALIIPLLGRVQGVRYLRMSATSMLVVLPVFLLVPSYEAKLVILGIIGLLNAGWYSILQAGLYTELPGKSGTVVAVSSVGSLPQAAFPALIGVLADQWGLDVALWVLLLGPMALLIGLPRADPPGLEAKLEEV